MAVSLTGLQVDPLLGELSRPLIISVTNAVGVKRCEWNAALWVFFPLKSYACRTHCGEHGVNIWRKKNLFRCVSVLGMRTRRRLLGLRKVLRRCADLIPHLHPLTVFFFLFHNTSCLFYHCVIRDEQKLS